MAKNRRLLTSTFIGDAKTEGQLKSQGSSLRFSTIPLKLLDTQITSGKLEHSFRGHLLRLANFVDRLGLGVSVYEEAYSAMVRAKSKMIIRRYKLATAACIYYACRKLAIPRSLEEICVVLPGCNRWKVAKIYRKICEGLDDRPGVSGKGDARLLASIAARASIPERVTRAALKMMQQLQSNPEFLGMSTRGFCSGLIYEAANRQGMKVSMRRVSMAGDASNETIRGHVRKIRAELTGLRFAEGKIPGEFNL